MQHFVRNSFRSIYTVEFYFLTLDLRNEKFDGSLRVVLYFLKFREIDVFIILRYKNYVRKTFVHIFPKPFESLKMQHCKSAATLKATLKKKKGKNN